MKNKKGFTLIEIIAIVSIIGLIITIATPKINEYIYTRKKDTFILNARNILRQIEYENLDSQLISSDQLINLEINKLSKEDFDLEKSMLYIVDDEAYLDLVGKGKYKEMYLCGVNNTNKKINVQDSPCDNNENKQYAELTINVDGGTLVKIYDGKYLSGSVKILETPKKDGYKFTGWTITSGNSTLSGNNLIMGSEDTVIKATWKETVVQAIYSETDNSLTFINDELQTQGGTYNGKEVTKLYTGFETKNYTYESYVPWFSYRQSIKKVEVLHEIAPISTAYWFHDLKNCDKIDLNNLDTSQVINMYGMFDEAGYNSETFILDLGDKFDTSNVTSMSKIFYSTGYNNPRFTLDLGNKFDTSSVTDMSYMFYYTGYKSETFILDLGDKFDTSSVINMDSMFGMIGRYSTEFFLNLGNNFDTSSVTNMRSMFRTIGSGNTEFTLDLGDKFDTSNVTDMSGMFQEIGYYCSDFTLDLGDDFDTSNVTNMASMFSSTGYNSTVFTLDLGDKFNTSKVTNMSGMFNHTGGNSLIFTLDLGDKFDTSSVTNMGYMFEYIGHNCPVFTLDLGDEFDTSNVTSMNQMFMHAGNRSTNFILDLGDKFVFKDGVTTNNFALYCGAKKLIIPATIINVPAFRYMHNLTEIVFKHSATDTITLPTAGSTGVFYAYSYINTTVTTVNDTIKNYDWAADKRTVTFN